MVTQSVSDLKNIGKTVETKLRTIGIHSAADLINMGSAKAYKWLSTQEPNNSVLALTNKKPFAPMHPSDACQFQRMTQAWW